MRSPKTWSPALVLAAIAACGPISPPPGALETPVRFEVTGISGAEAAQTHAAFAPLKTRLSECRRGGGVIRLRLVAGPGRARYTVEPDTTLDPRARRCVLETLSTVDVEGLATSDPNRTAQPSGFSALFRIEW